MAGFDPSTEVDDSGAARVESSFVPGRVVDLTPVADTFYLGELGGGSALVVQFDGDGALLDLTYTSYDEAGDLNYGVSGAGTFMGSSHKCVHDSAPSRSATPWKEAADVFVPANQR